MVPQRLERATPPAPRQTTLRESARGGSERFAAALHNGVSNPTRYFSALSKSATIFSAAEHAHPAEHDPPHPSPHLSEQSHSPRLVMRRTAHTAHATRPASITIVLGVKMISRIASALLYAAFFSASSLPAAFFPSNFGVGLNSWNNMAAATTTATTVHALKETSPVISPPSW